MTKYDYRAVPCPDRALRKRDLPKGADPFAETLTAAINELASEGWDYLRVEAVEIKTRRFLWTKTEERHFLVFRREARPLIEPRALSDLGGDIEKVRARRVKSEATVAFVRNGGRRIVPKAANENSAAPVTAAQ